MRYRLRTLLILLAIGPPLVAGVGCGESATKKSDQLANAPWREPLADDVQNILAHADEFTLWSIEGELSLNDQVTDTHFHGFRILGKTDVPEKSDRDELLSALYRGMQEQGGRAACFAPRHGISASIGNERVDLVICFECFTIVAFGNAEQSLFVSDSPQDVFNRALKRADIPLAD